MKHASNFRTKCASKFFKMRFQKLFSVKNELPKHKMRIQNYNYFSNDPIYFTNGKQNALPKFFSNRVQNALPKYFTNGKQNALPKNFSNRVQNALPKNLYKVSKMRFQKYLVIE